MPAYYFCKKRIRRSSSCIKCFGVGIRHFNVSPKESVLLVWCTKCIGGMKRLIEFLGEGRQYSSGTDLLV